MDNVLRYIDDNQDAFVTDLIEFLKIPSVSAQPEHHSDLALAADGLKGCDVFCAERHLRAGIVFQSSWPRGLFRRQRSDYTMPWGKGQRAK